MKIIAIALLVVLTSLSGAKAESSESPWLKWFNAINSHLRTSSTYLRTQNLDFAALALEDLIELAPPEGLSEELASAADDTIAEATKALAEIDEGDGAGARERLLKLREKLFNVNKYNGVETFDDCIWTTRKAAMPLWTFRRNRPDLQDENQREAVATATADYLAALERCDAIAPTAIKGDPEWIRVVVGSINSLNQILSESLINQDVGQLIRIIRELRSSDNILYFRYG